MYFNCTGYAFKYLSKLFTIKYINFLINNFFIYFYKNTLQLKPRYLSLLCKYDNYSLKMFTYGVGFG